MKSAHQFPIDVVVTWVDGNDPALNARRAAYIRPDEAREKDIAAPTRYADRGEIHWCIRSVNKFMPWVNRIFIVTDSQDPKVASRIPVEIIDHRVIFSGSAGMRNICPPSIPLASRRCYGGFRA